MPIPKVIHIVWIGDESMRPDDNIRTWAAMNPGYELRLWGNEEVRNHEWFLGDLINQWGRREINGAADIVRWEILFRYGGLAFDADSACVRPLEDWLLEPDAFAVWENEILRPGLMATGSMGFSPKHFLVGNLIKDIAADAQPFSGKAWQKLGPQRLTDTVRRLNFVNMTVYPSHYFLPRHHTGLEYNGSGPVFATQDWGSTFRSYQTALKPITGGPPTAGATAPAPRSGIAGLPDRTVRSEIVRGLNNQFYLQRLKVNDVPNRLPFIRALCAGKKVLHVGCTDFPVFDPNHNLHIQIADVCATLHGLDTDAEGLHKLSHHVPGRYFSAVAEIDEAYDLVLVPETIEHVSGIKAFLADLGRIDFKELFITAPCVIGWIDCFNYKDYSGRRAALLSQADDYIEEVHPDHKAWFTPYTLANCIEQYSDWQIEEVLFLEGKRMTAVHCSR